MRLHPGCLLPFAALLVLPLSGCAVMVGGAAVGAAIGAATTPAPRQGMRWQPGVALVVDFATPRELVADPTGGGQRLHLGDVTRVIGRVHDVRGDSVVLSIAELRRSRGAMTFPRLREPVAVLHVDDGTRVAVITVRSPATRSLLGAAAGTVAATLLAMAGFIIYCRNASCMN